jgi:polysaccharide export outer membrane protein
MKPLWLCLISVFTVLALGGCGGGSAHDIRAKLAVTETDYRIRPDDTVYVRVYEEIELTDGYKIDAQGMIAMPLVGKIALDGKTEREAGAAISKAYMSQGYLKNPRVVVEVRKMRPVSVIGEVIKQGDVTYQKGLTAYQAIARAGGFDYRADRDDIRLTRLPDIQKFLIEDTTVLMPGDVIEVGERFF